MFSSPHRSVTTLDGQHQDQIETEDAAHIIDKKEDIVKGLIARHEFRIFIFHKCQVTHSTVKPKVI